MAHLERSCRTPETGILVPDYVCLSIAVLVREQNPVPGSLVFGVQIHSGSADGPTHFRNEQATHVNLCLKCAMPIALLWKGLWLTQFCFNLASNAHSTNYFFPCVSFSQ